MKIRPFPRLPLAVASVLLAASALPAAAATEATFDRTYTVSGPVDLSAQTHSGNITVRAGSGPVAVHGRIRVRDRYSSDADKIIAALTNNPPIEQSGNTIHIRNIEDEWMRRRVSISYEITTPADTQAEAQSGSGNVDVGGIRGPVEARTGSGNIKVANVSGRTRAQTGSGNIDLASIGSEAATNTGSGNIEARGVAGAFSGSTGSGNVTVEQTAPGNVEMNSGSGNLEARGVQGSLVATTGSGGVTAEGDLRDDWRLRSSSGSIRVRLPVEAAFSIEARSSSGSIEVNHPLMVQGRIGKREVRGTVRGGGALLAVSTSSGSIRVD